jgi:hypothetical protein
MLKLFLKKTSLILLLAIIILQAGGVLFVYQLQQHQVKLQVKRDLIGKGTHFQKLELTLSQYNQSVINHNEIEFGDAMYDIKSMKVADGKVTLIVLGDTKEKKIVDRIRSHTNQTNNSKNKLPNLLEKVLDVTFLCSSYDYEFKWIEISDQVYSSCLVCLQSQSYETASPPPKVA